MLIKTQVSPANTHMRRGANAMGVCAGGHPLTAAAGARAFDAGGNAIDAAVAAQLMATVAEPLLTGLGGGGLAHVRFGGQDRTLDFFSDRPGLGPTRPIAPLEHVDVSFGVDLQRFSYGVASVATPGMIWGLWELHRAGGRLPLPMLARWAADQAERGLEVSLGLSKSIAALASIITRDHYLRERLMIQDASGAYRGAPAGHRYHLSELSATLMRWAEGGPDALFSGASRAAIFETLGDFAPLSELDIDRYRVQWRDPLSRTLKLTSGESARLLTPALPSQGGVQISALLDRVTRQLYAQASANTTPQRASIAPLGAKSIALIASEMRALEGLKSAHWPRELTENGDPYWLDQLGFTTHISASDREGNAVGITSSLGETAGVSVSSLGLLLNNFLGETDVAPPHCMPAIGERLYTMCSPSLFEYETARGLQSFMMGSGGSSRIRSVVAQGALYAHPELLGLEGDRDDLDAYLNTLVRAPRVHYEGGKLRVETFERSPDAIAQTRALCERWGAELICFDDLNLFFGGLHLTAYGALGLSGAGDPRRSGSVSFG